MKHTLRITVGMLITSCLAMSQEMDASFGTNGIVVTEISQSVDALNALALQPDGKIVALGFANGKLTLSRHETNGTLDATFGNAGISTSNFYCGFGGPYILKLLADGKMLVLARNSNDMIIIRYNSNGTIDTAFGTNGLANISAFIANSPFASSMELLPDGKIVVTGYIGVNSIFLIKYTADGVLDTTFGTNGYTISQLPGISSLSIADSCITADGSILLASNVANELGYGDFSLIKYHANGILDTDFGTGGFLITDIGGITVSDSPSAIKLQQDGKIVVSGISSLNFAAIRYNTDGSLDTTFNSTGIALINVGGIYRICADMLIEPDGKIVLAGYIGDDFGSVRYNSNGSTDTSYGNNGIFKKDFGNSYEYGSAIIRQPDGKFIMGGWTSFFCTNRAFAMIRFSSPTLSTREYGIDNSIGICPNPSGSFINIKSSFTIESIALYDIQGRLLSAIPENSSEVIFNVEDRQNGIYFLKVNTSGGSETQKIFKK